jgi:DNA-binding NarL/FixJ family response regulator
VLNSQGIDVVGVALTCAEAIQRAGELDPDVALIDVCLGAESGFDLARQLRGTASAERTKVILVSAYPEADFADMIAASPCLGFLPKASLSGEAIRALLEHSRRRGLAEGPRTGVRQKPPAGRTASG